MIVTGSGEAYGKHVYSILYNSLHYTTIYILYCILTTYILYVFLIHGTLQYIIYYINIIYYALCMLQLTQFIILYS